MKLNVDRWGANSIRLFMPFSALMGFWTPRFASLPVNGEVADAQAVGTPGLPTV
jgi:hypothetical protein